MLFTPPQIDLHSARSSEAMAPIFAFWGTCKRGAATAVYDYAHFGESLLGIDGC